MGEDLQKTAKEFHGIGDGVGEYHCQADTREDGVLPEREGNQGRLLSSFLPTFPEDEARHERNAEGEHSNVCGMADVRTAVSQRPVPHESI